MKSNLGFNEPEFTVGPDPSKLFYYPDAVEDDEDNEFDFMKKNVCNLPGGGMTDNCSFTVTDLSQGDLKATIQVVHTNDEDFDEEKFPEKFEVSGTPSIKKSTSSSETTGDVSENRKRKAEELDQRSASVVNMDDEIVILDGPNDIESIPKKAKIA